MTDLLLVPCCRFVWATYTNDIGWPSPFLVVATGLINPAFVYLGCDAAVHIAEETMRPERDIPRAMLVSITAGLVFVLRGKRRLSLTSVRSF